MIDLHSHFLPAIDDGAGSLDESLRLLRRAHIDGIEKLVATPHMYPGVFDNSIKSIREAFDLVVSSASQIPVDIAVAAEVRISEHILPAIEKGDIPFLGKYSGMDVLLLEFPHSHIPPGADKLVKWLISKNVIPMIAHPERNRDIQSNPQLLVPFRRMNCLFQLTASSINGEMGERAMMCAEYMLKNRLYSIVASDMHSELRRPPQMGLARQKISKLCDDGYSEELTYTTPFAISSHLDFISLL